MIACVVPVAGLRREVDAAHEGDSIVDHDRLFMVAVQRPLASVQRALDARARSQLVVHLPYFATRRAEERKRRPGPYEDTHVNGLGQLRKEIAQDDGLVVPEERETGT